MRTGYIPKTITVITRKQSEKVSSWRFEYLDNVADDLEVFKSIVVGDQAKSGTYDTARNWADRNGKYTEIIENNEPKKYRVVNLEIRSEGGRAWKVVDDQNRYYDLREDSLLYSLITDGCEPKGILRNEMVWGICDNTTKLIPVNSAIYFALVEAQDRREAKNIKKSDLKIGYLYKTKSEDLFIYCGPVNSLNIEHGKSTRWNQSSTVEKVQEKLNQQLWYQVYNGKYTNKDKTDLEKAQEDVKENNYWRYDVVADKKVIEEIGYVGGSVDMAIASYKTAKQSYNFIDANCKPIKNYLSHFDQSTQNAMVSAQNKGVYYV